MRMTAEARDRLISVLTTEFVRQLDETIAELVHEHIGCIENGVKETIDRYGMDVNFSVSVSMPNNKIKHILKYPEKYRDFHRIREFPPYGRL